MRWDLFCRVVDNFGDVGVCWRLAADLAARGERVRLWIDDASALRWMAPHGAAGVTVAPWPAGPIADDPGEVVIEAFGCELPAAFVRRMADAVPAPVWINLEYLSAESFAERSHRLASPQAHGAGAGLSKWFFYPGYTALTGGLIREPDLLERQRVFDPGAWLSARGLQAPASERIVSLFCYEQPALPALLERLAEEPTLLLVAAGLAASQVERLLGTGLRKGALRAALLPALAQRDYDHLLWASDLNFVRGEDSFARAQWAGKPFVWQIYPQRDGAHVRKLDAFLERFLVGADAGLAASVSALWGAWNSFSRSIPSWPDEPTWTARCLQWRAQLLLRADLATQLVGFAAESR
jgi:uncharacterized repeat protein (TIGR03837 family)